MGATTQDKATRPLGVIGCLAAGFETVGRHLWLIALPVLLDLFLWLGPRLSVAPLVRGFLAILGTQSVYDPETTRQSVQAMERLGEQFNLFSLLSALPLLNMPSLLAQRVAVTVSPLGEPRVFLVTNGLVLIAWVGVLVSVGLVLGFLYLYGLARQVCAVRFAEKQGTAPGRDVLNPAAKLGTGVGQEEDLPGGSGAGKLIRVFLFAVGLLMTGMAFLLALAMLVGLSAAVVQLLGGAVTIVQLIPDIVLMISIGLAGYIVLHLLFVVHGVLLGGRGLLRAIWESVVIIHVHLPYVVVLMVLVVIVYRGLGYVWSLPPSDSWLFLIGVLGNSCVATALIAATFVFYQERVGLLPGARQVSARN